jgi:hypothetical protein
VKKGNRDRLDFADNGELKARITPTHLVVFRQGRPPEEIPLEQIMHVLDFLMPSGMIGVNVFTNRPADVPDPGMSFGSPRVLASFVETLRERIRHPNEASGADR